MLSREQWAHQAAAVLKAAGIDSARLDAELLLAHALQLSRTSLHASFDKPLAENIIPILDAAVDVRVSRVPLAYIIGHKEFYKRLFLVTPEVLVPRPESEAFIDILRGIDKLEAIIDVGTGSGVLAITALLETSAHQALAIDISEPALEVARSNALAHHVNIKFLKNDLLNGLIRPPIAGKLIVIANLPYVDKDWDTSPEIQYEPNIALFADDGGLAQIDKLLVEASILLEPNDAILLESDMRQHAHVIQTAEALNLKHSGTSGLIQHFTKI